MKRYLVILLAVVVCAGCAKPPISDIENVINTGISYLGKPVPNDFVELDKALYKTLFLKNDMTGDLYIEIKNENFHLDDGVEVWFSYVKDGIIISSQIYYFFQNIHDAMILLENYNHFFEDQGWIPFKSEKEQSEDTFAFVEKDETYILCNKPFKLSDIELVFIIIIFTNEELKKQNKLLQEELKEAKNKMMGDYRFSSVDIEYIDENEDIDRSSYEDLDENIYIKIVKADADKFKIESNFWLLEEKMNLDDVYNHFPHIFIVDNLNFPFPMERIGHLPPSIIYHPALRRNSYFEISYTENGITIDYRYEDSHMEKVTIEEKTDIEIIEKGLGTATHTNSVKNVAYSPSALVVKCRFYFQKREE